MDLHKTVIFKISVKFSYFQKDDVFNQNRKAKLSRKETQNRL